MTLVSGDMTSGEMTFGRLDRKPITVLTSVYTRQPVAATCRTSSVLENFCEKSLSPQQNFVTTKCCKKSNQTEFVQLFLGQSSVADTKIFHKNSPVHTK